MSRSYRKTPVIRGSNRCSDKEWRRSYNRKLRRANKVRLQIQGEDFIAKLVREVSNAYDSQRDHTWGFWGDKYGGRIFFPTVTEYSRKAGELRRYTRPMTESELENERNENRGAYRKALRK